MLKIVAFAIVALFFPVQADICCLGKQWSSDIFVTSNAHYHSQDHFSATSGQISVDSVGERIASRVFFKKGAKYEFVRTVLDYKNKHMYVIFKDKCWVKPLVATFQKQCIPDTAKEVSKSTMGYGNDKLNMNVYEVKFNGKYGPYTVYLGMTPDCVPVGEFVHAGDVFTSNSGFTNFEPKLKDPSMFDHPTNCSSYSFKPHVPQHTDFLTEYMSARFSA